MVIATAYPGSRVVTVADLDEYNASLFKREHHDDCAGMVKVDFYGNGASTLALALRGKTEGQDQTKLVLATKAATWKLRLLDTMDGFAAVVWSGCLWQEGASSKEPAGSLLQIRNSGIALRVDRQTRQ